MIGVLLRTSSLCCHRHSNHRGQGARCTWIKNVLQNDTIAVPRSSLEVVIFQSGLWWIASSFFPFRVIWRHVKPSSSLLHTPRCINRRGPTKQEQPDLVVFTEGKKNWEYPGSAPIYDGGKSHPASFYPAPLFSKVYYHIIQAFKSDYAGMLAHILLSMLSLLFCEVDLVVKGRNSAKMISRIQNMSSAKNVLRKAPQKFLKKYWSMWPKAYAQV